MPDSRPMCRVCAQPMQLLDEKANRWYCFKDNEVYYANLTLWGRPRCPTCGKHMVMEDEMGERWSCPEHGLQKPQASESPAVSAHPPSTAPELTKPVTLSASVYGRTIGAIVGAILWAGCVFGWLLAIGIGWSLTVGGSPLAYPSIDVILSLPFAYIGWRKTRNAQKKCFFCKAPLVWKRQGNRWVAMNQDGSVHTCVHTARRGLKPSNTRAPSELTKPVTEPSVKPVSTKFCRFCGAKILRDSEYCEECGKKLLWTQVGD